MNPSEILTDLFQLEKDHDDTSSTNESEDESLFLRSDADDDGMDSSICSENPGFRRSPSADSVLSNFDDSLNGSVPSDAAAFVAPSPLHSSRPNTHTKPSINNRRIQEFARSLSLDSADTIDTNPSLFESPSCSGHHQFPPKSPSSRNFMGSSSTRSSLAHRNAKTPTDRSRRNNMLKQDRLIHVQENGGIGDNSKLASSSPTVLLSPYAIHRRTFLLRELSPNSISLRTADFGGNNKVPSAQQSPTADASSSDDAYRVKTPSPSSTRLTSWSQANVHAGGDSTTSSQSTSHSSRDNSASDYLRRPSKDLNQSHL